MILKILFCLSLLQFAISVPPENRPPSAVKDEPCFECCKYPMKSPEYNDCCAKRKCCPDCNNVPFGPFESYSIRQDCDGAWKCCLLPFLSDEFHACCMLFGCCPLCDDVPEGCCFGNEMKEFGSTVAFYPEVCMELKCGAIVQDVAPYVVPKLMPHHLRPSVCTGDPCGNVMNRYCIDKYNIVHEDYDHWYDRATCQACFCDYGTIICYGSPCPPPPAPHCRPVGNGCCPEYDCNEQLSCAAPNSFDLKCNKPRDECDADEDCGVDQHCCTVAGCGKTCVQLCVAEDGTRHAVGESWQSRSDPCTVFTCEGGGRISRKDDTCPDCSEKPAEECTWVHPAGECCGHWECNGKPRVAGQNGKCLIHGKPDTPVAKGLEKKEN
ncbi:kielin/chordin-like protein [Penaeus japonicus]|uniref:kielin/chordin-like protein n=1 Tax=Penaeus japonicus TaxID=27405 RepID=UPI001C7125EB|nr:kielin/chordin-like protein [Penaeus japonicus]